jgi:hypothetical protein
LIEKLRRRGIQAGNVNFTSGSANVGQQRNIQRNVGQHVALDAALLTNQYGDDALLADQWCAADRSCAGCFAGVVAATDTVTDSVRTGWLGRSLNVLVLGLGWPVTQPMSALGH